MSGVEVDGLPEVLRRLAELIPSRVKLGHLFRDGVQNVYVFDDTWVDYDGWLLVYGFNPMSATGGFQRDRSWRDTRAALEQEIEARGWTWAQRTITADPPAYATVYGPVGSDIMGTSTAHTPAHALALALLSALS